MLERNGSCTSTSTWGCNTNATSNNETGVTGGETETGKMGNEPAEPGIRKSETDTEKSEGEMNGHTTEMVEKRDINPCRVHLRYQPGRGNGVFASERIAAGTVIEESPVLLITREQWAKGDMQETILGEYGFCWSGGGQGLGLGLGELHKTGDLQLS